MPPIKTTDEALEYKAHLQAIDPTVEYLMTLYLNPNLNPDEIRKAACAGIVGKLPSPSKDHAISIKKYYSGVKSYPRGVTTNSDGGISPSSIEEFYPVFAAMEETGMVLNLHGELPSDAHNNICVINAENHFLPVLRTLHAKFPKLRIVLEHATTRAAVECVKELGDTVACTITAHHLAMTVDDWAGQPWHYCKPVAKFPHDRLALQEVVKEGMSGLTAIIGKPFSHRFNS